MIRRSSRARAALVAFASLLSLFVGDARPVRAKLAAPKRAVVTAYLSALQHRDFPGAFARLSDDERRYFRSSRNFEAVFAADRFALDGFTILESAAGGKAGTIVVVRERVRFYDHAHQRDAKIDANVRYGIVPSSHGPAIKDPYHPWFSFAPTHVTTRNNGVTVTVRKISFYTGRIEVLATFANTGDTTVTILPYGRTVVRDDAGKTHVPIRSKLAGLTDAALFGGLRLPPSAQYTGAMTFVTADRFVAKLLRITFAPALLDGGEAPFDFVLPEVAVPPVS